MQFRLRFRYRSNTPISNQKSLRLCRLTMKETKIASQLISHLIKNIQSCLFCKQRKKRKKHFLFYLQNNVGFWQNNNQFWKATLNAPTTYPCPFVKKRKHLADCSGFELFYKKLSVPHWKPCEQNSELLNFLQISRVCIKRSSTLDSISIYNNSSCNINKHKLSLSPRWESRSFYLEKGATYGGSILDFHFWYKIEYYKKKYRLI